MRRQFNDALDALPPPGFVFLPHPPEPPIAALTPTILSSWGPPSVDTASYFSPMAPSLVTVPPGFGGPHLVSFFTVWDPGPALTDRILRLLLFGSPLRESKVVGSSSGGPTEHGMTWHLDLSVGDALSIEVEHDSGGPPIGLGAGSFWSVQKIT